MNNKLKQLELKSKQRKEQMNNYNFKEKDKIANDNFNDLEREVYSNINDKERYCTVAESIEQSLKEMQLMREGKIPKKTWREHMEEWYKWAKEVEEELDSE